MSQTATANVVASVCARGGSKGVPGKNLRVVAGLPLIAHAIKCGQAAQTIQRVVASTDDDAIAEAARSYGADVPFMRPAELAQDDTGKWLVFRHLVTELEQRGERVDVLVDLGVEVPTRSSQDVDACVNALLNSDADVVVTVYEADRNPYFNMVEVGPEGYAHLVKDAGRLIVYRQDAPTVYSVSPSIFAIRRDALWDTDHWSHSKLVAHVVPRDRAIDIDSELDLTLVELVMERAKQGSQKA